MKLFGITTIFVLSLATPSVAQSNPCPNLFNYLYTPQGECVDLSGVVNPGWDPTIQSEDLTQIPYWLRYSVEEIANMPNTRPIPNQEEFLFNSQFGLYMFAISNRWLYSKIPGRTSAIDCATGWLYSNLEIAEMDFTAFSPSQNGREELMNQRIYCREDGIPVGF